MAALVDDGLTVSEVGDWATEKHDRLERYVDIARGVRKSFIGKAGATYIDLYSGPGRSRIKNSGRLIPGSPLVAATKAREGRAGFSSILISDSDATFVNAAKKRLEAEQFSPLTFVGKAEDTVISVVEKLDPYALHFAFLDPFKLDDLPFTIIETLAALKRMDLLIHVSVQDLNRNLRRYLAEQGGPLDRVAPGWRAAVDERQQDHHIRKAFLDHWLKLIRALDMTPSQGFELVAGSNNQPLYWLVLVARHDLAGQFWDRVRNVSPQGRLNL